jgi:hypothetical protein
MSSVIVGIADAVTEALNGATLSQPVTAQRSYLPRFELPEMAQLKVTVVPSAVEITTAGRNRATERYRIDIGVQKKLASEDVAEVDALSGLAQEIADHFRFKRLAGYPSAVWVRTEHEPLYDPAHMEQMRQFTAVIRLTYQVTR